MKALFWNFVLEFLVLVLALCGDKKKKKMDFLQITYSKECKNMAVEETSGDW